MFHLSSTEIVARRVEGSVNNRPRAYYIQTACDVIAASAKRTHRGPEG